MRHDNVDVTDREKTLPTRVSEAIGKVVEALADSIKSLTEPEPALVPIKGPRSVMGPRRGRRVSATGPWRGQRGPQLY